MLASDSSWEGRPAGGERNAGGAAEPRLPAQLSPHAFAPSMGRSTPGAPVSLPHRRACGPGWPPPGRCQWSRRWLAAPARWRWCWRRSAPCCRRPPAWGSKCSSHSASQPSTRERRHWAAAAHAPSSRLPNPASLSPPATAATCLPAAVDPLHHGLHRGQGSELGQLADVGFLGCPGQGAARHAAPPTCAQGAAGQLREGGGGGLQGGTTASHSAHALGPAPRPPHAPASAAPDRVASWRASTPSSA